MDEEEIDRFLEPFEQTSTERSSRYDEAGLELTAGSRLVERRGGRLAIESETGEGTKIAEGLLHVRRERGLTENSPALAPITCARTGDAESFLQIGLEGYLAKPFAQKALRAALNRVRIFLLEASRSSPLTGAGGFPGRFTPR